MCVQGIGSINRGRVNTDLGMSISRKGFLMEPMISPPSELGSKGACPPEGVKCMTTLRCDTAYMRDKLLNIPQVKCVQRVTGNKAGAMSAVSC